MGEKHLIKTVTHSRRASTEIEKQSKHVSRNGLLYRIKFAQTIACCLQEQ